MNRIEGLKLDLKISEDGLRQCEFLLKHTEAGTEEAKDLLFKIMCHEATISAIKDVIWLAA